MIKLAKVTMMVAALLSLGLIAGCHTTASTKTRKLAVVTTTNFYGEVARAIGGDQVQVTSVINRPTVDPHDYEPTSQVAAQVAKADVLVANGLGYDGWLAKLAKNAPNAQLINVGETVLGKRVGVNPHLWYDPQTMPALARFLTKRFSRERPKYRATFQANLKQYLASLKPLTAELAALKEQAQQQSTKRVLVSEPVFDYALANLGFKVGNGDFEAAIEKGTDPAPQVIKAMQTDLRQRRVAFFVQNKQVSSPLVTNMVKLAHQHHVPVLQVTETMPAKQNYRQWMLGQYRTLNQLLKTADNG